MDLTNEILTALNNGENALDILRKAKDAGVSQADAIEASQRVFNFLPPEESVRKNVSGLTIHDYATEVTLLAAGWCHPSQRLWSNE